MFLGVLLQIFEDAAIELIDVCVSLAFHLEERLLASDSSRAEHEYLFILGNAGILHIRRELTELFQFRIDCFSKRADVHFVVIAYVQEDDILPLDHLIPFSGTHVIMFSARENRCVTQCDNFFTDFYVPTPKGWIFAAAIFEQNVFVNTSEVVLELFDRFLGSCDCSVQPFLCHKDETDEIYCLPFCIDCISQARHFFYREEVVEGGDGEGGSHDGE